MSVVVMSVETAPAFLGASISLKTIVSAVLLDRQPFDRTVVRLSKKPSTMGFGSDAPAIHKSQFSDTVEPVICFARLGGGVFFFNAQWRSIDNVVAEHPAFRHHERMELAIAPVPIQRLLARLFRAVRVLFAVVQCKADSDQSRTEISDRPSSTSIGLSGRG